MWLNFSVHSTTRWVLTSTPWHRRICPPGRMPRPHLPGASRTRTGPALPTRTARYAWASSRTCLTRIPAFTSFASSAWKNGQRYGLTSSQSKTLLFRVNYLTFGATIAKILRNNANISRKYDVQACRTYFLLSLYNGFRYIIQVGGF